MSVLRHFRKMGSMEQIFTIFNDDKIAGWGPMTGVEKINGLSKIPLETIQSCWNKIHAKYQSFQCQILTTSNVNEYDDIYIGCVPFKIIRCNGEDQDKLLVKELNHRFLLLNDLNLSHQDIIDGKYDINNIPPLYRIFIIDDWLLLNFNHCTADGLSFIAMLNDFLALLNNDTFDPTLIKYSTIEQCIKPHLASSALTRKINNLIPTSWALRFGKFYATNYYLRKYNPLSLHRDELLRFQFYFSKEFLTFPLKAYNKKDYSINFKTFRLSHKISKGLRKQCKLHKIHMSSLFQYLAIAALIECHDVLKDNYYKTQANNVFTTIPMYKDPDFKKVYLGIHACGYGTVIEYYRNIKIGSDKFWDNLGKIDAQVLNDNMVSKVYKNKFPYMNLKKFMRFWLNDESEIFKGIGGAPTITNPGLMDINKDYWKHKITESYGGANPGVGMGAVFLLGGTTIKGVGGLRMNCIYGKQHLSETKATMFMDKLQQKLKVIGGFKTNYQSKL
eukprot:70005_1